MAIHTPDPKPDRPADRPADRPTPGRPDHDLPKPGHPDHDLPGTKSEPTPEPKRGSGPAGRAAAPRSALPPAPVLTGLLPPSACVGDPSFSLRVVGAPFTADSVMVVAGQDEPTTFVSETELTTGMNMDVWLGPDPAIPVLVRNADGQESNTLLFVLAEPRAVPLDEAHASKPVPLMMQI